MVKSNSSRLRSLARCISDPDAPLQRSAQRELLPRAHWPAAINLGSQRLGLRWTGWKCSEWSAPPHHAKTIYTHIHKIWCISLHAHTHMDRFLHIHGPMHIHVEMCVRHRCNLRLHRLCYAHCVCLLLVKLFDFLFSFLNSICALPFSSFLYSPLISFLFCLSSFFCFSFFALLYF